MLPSTADPGATPVHRLLVALDLRAGEEPVLHMARSLARVYGAEVYLVHVAEAEPEFVGFQAGPPSVRDGWAARFREEHQELARRASGWEGVTSVTPLLVQGGVAAKLVEEARRLLADLIVVGSRTSVKFYPVRTHGVAGEVVDRSSGPVLVVPLRRSDRAAEGGSGGGP